MKSILSQNKFHIQVVEKRSRERERDSVPAIM